MVRVHQVLAAALVLAASAAAQNTPSHTKPFFLPVNIPATDEDPVMDGAATSNPEWEDGMLLPDSFFFGAASRSGFYWFERKNDWNAIPAGALVDGAGLVYEGLTLFVAHDIVGSSDPENPLHQFQVDEARDWNSFEFNVPSGRATIWVFDAVNDTDDGDWLPYAEGLDTSSLIPELTDPDRIDDRGFIARLNDDPSTDVHWFETDPEPGDAGWDWETWHYVFGRRSFGQSFQDLGLDPDPENAVDHEVYEACSYRPDYDPDDDDPPPPFCLWWDVEEETEVEVKDVMVMKDGTPTKAKVTVSKTKQVPILKGQWWLHYWDEQVFGIGVPEASPLAFLVAGQIATALKDANPPEKAMEDANFIHSHLLSVMLLAASHNYTYAFQSLKYAKIHMGRAEKKGLNKLALLHARMLVVSYVYWVMALHALQLDRFGLPPALTDGAGGGLSMDDKDLGKISRGFYAFGKALEQTAAKGEKGQGKVLNTIDKLKKIGKILEDLDPPN